MLFEGTFVYCRPCGTVETHQQRRGHHRQTANVERHVRYQAIVRDQWTLVDSVLHQSQIAKTTRAAWVKGGHQIEDGFGLLGTESQPMTTL